MTPFMTEAEAMYLIGIASLVVIIALISLLLLAVLEGNRDRKNKDR